MNKKLTQARLELGEIYDEVQEKIEKRIEEFKAVLRLGDENRLFMELSFCLLTPASKAKNAWKAVEQLHQTGLLYNGREKDIANYLNTVRFKNNKARNIVLARSIFYINNEFKFHKLFENFKNDSFNLREWFVKNIRGMAYKEATHFLRNIGMASDLCILDRHILRNLKYYEVIDEIPTSLSRNRYLTIEKRMQEYSKLINIPVDHLDFILWYKETGEIFK